MKKLNFSLESQRLLNIPPNGSFVVFPCIPTKIHDVIFAGADLSIRHRDLSNTSEIRLDSDWNRNVAA